MVELKRDLKHGAHAFFEPVRPHIIYLALSEDMLKFSDYFSKRSYLMVHWEKENMPHVLNFKKKVARMSIPSNGFSMHQIFKIKLPTLSLLRKQCSVGRPFE